MLPLLISLNWFMYILLGLLIIGIVLYLVNNYLPVDQKLKRLINVVVVLAVIIYLIYLFIQLKP